jgi:hypothetical protein
LNIQIGKTARKHKHLGMAYPGAYTLALPVCHPCGIGDWVLGTGEWVVGIGRTED